jgi:uncharacterized protein (TIGR02391 family)
MLLTDEELQLVRETVALQSGIDHDLIQQCSRLIHINAFDEAVQQAFVVLEERMRRLLKKERATGMQMVQFAFSQSGPFTKLLADNQPEREGFEHLLSGAFKLYRNPTAHTIVGYSGADARSVIGLVDLILKRLGQIAAITQIKPLPTNVEDTLLLVEKRSGAKVANQARLFLAKCSDIGLDIDQSATKWIPFRKRPLTKHDNWKKAKPHTLAVFYFYNTGKDQTLLFPVNSYYKYVVGIDRDEITKRLRNLGFQLAGSAQDPSLSVNTPRDKDYYDKLFVAVQQIAEELEATLH